MDLSSLKNKFSNLTLGPKEEPDRILSDIELLNDEQYQFLEQYTQNRFFTYMQTYWGSKLLDANITCKSDKGEILNVEPSSIRVIDRRYKGASHCRCGKAIRYEYWIKHYGPIGSVHICEHTGLDKTLVADITKGYKKENELRTELVHIIHELKQNGEDFDKWAERFNISSKIDYINRIKSEQTRTLILRLIELKLPLTKSLRDAINLAEYQYRISPPIVSTPIPQPEFQAVGPPPAPPALPAGSALSVKMNELLMKYNSLTWKTVNIDKVNNLRNIAREVGKPNVSIKMVQYAESLIKDFEKALITVPTPEWIANQANAQRVLKAIIDSDKTNNFALSLYNCSIEGCLTDKQLHCIFDEKVNGKYAGLFFQYGDLMKANSLERSVL